MNTRLRRLSAATLSAFTLISVVPLHANAQSVPSPTGQAALAGDPPGRVARLNYFTGNVTLEPAGATEWSYAQLNRPLTTGDQLWADSGARGELHAGSTALRVDQQTALSIVDLDDATLQLKVTQGGLSTRVRALPTGQTVEIDTPNVAMQVNSPGEFRVDVAPDGSSTTVTLREGTATLYGDGGSYQMVAGQQARFVGVNLQQQSAGPAPAPDAFDQWVATRDRAEDGSVSARYVSREIPGYQDLDANGTWRTDPTYGEIWTPTVAVSQHWAPYHEGHWAWIAPWGWTWIDDAPWGFAPFHYGRWAYVSNAWAWVPGPVEVVRPVYAPALVAFVGGDGGGGGTHWGVDLAIGGAVGAGVAWFALGPHEPWHPGYRYSPGYFNRVNNGNITNVNVTNIHNNVHNTTIINNVHNTYINQTAPGAITAVPASTFVRGQPVAQAARVLPAQEIARARIGAGGPGIAPVRESFTGGMRAASMGAPAALAQRDVIATRRPVVPAAYRDTFAQRLAGSGGRVPGAGDPVVRTSVPAAFIGGAREVKPGQGATRQPGSYAAPQGYRLVDKTQARPVGPQGAPMRGAAPGEVNAARPVPGGRNEPMQPQASANANPNLNPNNAQAHGPVSGGQIARPPQNAAEMNRPQEAQRSAQGGGEHRGEVPAQQAPNVPHPNGPATSQPQHEAPPVARAEPQQRAEPQPRNEPQQHAEPQPRNEPREQQARPEPQHNAPQQAQQPRPEPQHTAPQPQQHAEPQRPQSRPPEQHAQAEHAQPHQEAPHGGEHHEDHK